jgi:hypothetical protein
LNGRLHNLHHLLSNELLVGSLGKAGSLNLSWCFLGESNAEHSDDVSIGGLRLDVALNESVPLLDHGASLVSGDVHTVEVGVAVEALDLIDLELELSPVLGAGSIVDVGESGSENTTSQGVSRVNQTGSLVHWGQGDLSLIESWGKDVVPFLSGEWVAAINIKLEVMIAC